MQTYCSERERREQMTRTGYFWRLGISIIIDLMDFTLGRIPILGTVEDGAAGIVLTAIWGRAGLAYFWELLDITDQIDGFVPTATLIGLYVGWREGHLGAGKRNVPAQQP
jgi:hypothetical protein